MLRLIAMASLAAVLGCSFRHTSSPTFEIDAPPPIATPTADDPVTVIAWASPDLARPGGEIELHVEVALAAGYHLQPVDAPPPFAATSIRLEPHADFLETGPWLCSNIAPHTPLTDTVTWTTNLRPGGKLAAGRYPFRCILIYQACDSELCWPVRTVMLTPTITVTK